jgi:DNA invertase Pin-like site-specific DNA recombinase
LGCGAKIDRANMRRALDQRALDQLDAGDVLMVTRLDRLAGKIRAPLAFTPTKNAPVAPTITA